jgi:hypothetical protein
VQEISRDRLLARRQAARRRRAADRAAQPGAGRALVRVERAFFFASRNCVEVSGGLASSELDLEGQPSSYRDPPRRFVISVSASMPMFISDDPNTMR